MKGGNIMEKNKNLWELLADLKKRKWIELSHELTNDSPYWGGMPEGVLEVNKTVIDYNEMNLQIQTFKFPGQIGTHIDYPAHFIQGARRAGDFKITDTILPLVVVDLTDKVVKNNDYEYQVSDLLEFEEKYGKIDEGSFVVVKSGWSKRWPSIKELENKDENGQNHTPGWSMEALEFLINERKVAGVGHETLDTDSGLTVTKTQDLPGERYLLSQDKFQVEVLKNLENVPEKGAIIFIAAPRIIEANGLPVRVWAIV